MGGLIRDYWNIVEVSVILFSSHHLILCLKLYVCTLGCTHPMRNGGQGISIARDYYQDLRSPSLFTQLIARYPLV